MKPIVKNLDNTIGLCKLEEKDGQSFIGIFDLEYIEEIIKFCRYFNDEFVTFYKVNSNKGYVYLSLIPGAIDPKKYNDTMICVAEIDPDRLAFDKYSHEDIRERMLHFGYKDVSELDSKIGAIEKKMDELYKQVQELKQIRNAL